MLPAESAEVKTCCAALYESDIVRLLLGDSFHPGGLQLTQRLGEMLGLGPRMRVLDVASGKGESALFLAKHFGCEVVGLDFGAGNVREASSRAEAAGLTHLVSFRQGDAEAIDFPDASFDRVICECAFCTFPGKQAAAREFARVLKPGGKVGLGDLTCNGSLPAELEGLLAWVACIADARPVEEYARYFEAAGCHIEEIQPHDNALTQMVRDVQGRLMGLELMVKLKKLELPGTDFDQARGVAAAAMQAIRTGLLGYSLLTARLG